MLRQLLDNSLLTAGLLYESKNFVTRIDQLMETHLDTLLANRLEDSKSAQRPQEEETSEKDADSVLRETIQNFKNKSNENFNVTDDIKIGDDGLPRVDKK